MQSLNELDSKIASKDELAQRSSGDFYLPMEADDYIALIADMQIVAKNDFENGQVIKNKWHPEYKITALCYSLKGGGVMRKIKNKEGVKQEVAPFEHWFIFNLNPTKMGFTTDKVTPSLTRGFLAYLLDIDVTEEASFKANVLLDPDYNIVKDQGIIDKYLKEVFDPNEPQDLRAKGYTHFKDFRQFLGRYIALTTQIDKKKKGENEYFNEKITKFGKLPSTFVKPSQDVEDAAMAAFNEKMMKKAEKDRTKNVSNNEIQSHPEVDQIKIEDVPL